VYEVNCVYGEGMLYTSIIYVDSVCTWRSMSYQYC
jgi:hypothetical protein